jgi:glutathione S-transferase
VLKELSLPYKIETIAYEKLHAKPFEDINPNGRAPGKPRTSTSHRHHTQPTMMMMMMMLMLTLSLSPSPTALHDPNTNITLWESNAINEYLIEQYDTSHKISHGSAPEKYLEKQFNYYQASGQGPYFGQGAWFFNYHPEVVPSARERYDKEVRRVIKVLDGILAERKYLVGEKMTYADLSYFMWNHFISSTVEPGTWKIEEYPNFKRWHEEMAERESVKASLKEREDTMAASS